MRSQANGCFKLSNWPTSWIWIRDCPTVRTTYGMLTVELDETWRTVVFLDKHLFFKKIMPYEFVAETHISVCFSILWALICSGNNATVLLTLHCPDIWWNGRGGFIALFRPDEMLPYCDDRERAYFKGHLYHIGLWRCQQSECLKSWSFKASGLYQLIKSTNPSISIQYLCVKIHADPYRRPWH